MNERAILQREPDFHWFSGVRSFAFSVVHTYRVACWNYRTVVF